MKMTHYKTHFLHTLEDGFIIRPSYMDIHLSYVLHNVIGQLQTSSLSVRDWGMDICTTTSRRKNLPIVSSWSEIEHYVCHCGVFYKIRGSYHCLFKQGFGPICKVMEYEDHRCLGLILLECQKHREKLLKDFYRCPTTKLISWVTYKMDYTETMIHINIIYMPHRAQKSIEQLRVSSH